MKASKGQILVFSALLIPLLLVFVGLGVDTGSLYAQKARLQNAADAAALAGASYLNDEFNGNQKCHLVSSLPETKELADEIAIANAGADFYLRKNTDNRISTSQENAVKTSLYKKQADDGGTLYYYCIELYQISPNYFMKIIDINETTIGVSAIAVCYKPKAPSKDWYHMFHWELEQISVEERLAYDQQALLNMAALFLGRTAEQALKIINPTKPQATVNHIKNGKEILILNYRDEANDDTYIQTMINFSDTRSPQAINWSRGDFGEYSETTGGIPLDTYQAELGHFTDMRFFFSDWMLQTRTDVDYNRRTFRISFKVNDAGIITEARVRVNRSRNYLHELDMTARSDGYRGKTNPDKTGAYTDKAIN